MSPTAPPPVLISGSRTEKWFETLFYPKAGDSFKATLRNMLFSAALGLLRRNQVIIFRSHFPHEATQRAP